jgi:hypothetical protein
MGADNVKWCDAMEYGAVGEICDNYAMQHAMRYAHRGCYVTVQAVGTDMKRVYSLWNIHCAYYILYCVLRSNQDQGSGKHRPLAHLLRMRGFSKL